MKKRIFVITLILLSGCATVKESQYPETLNESANIKNSAKQTQNAKSKKSEIINKSPKLHNIKNEQLDEYANKKGVIFAKTDFRGILKTSYVRLLFEDKKDKKNKFQLLIGANDNKNKFIWDIKPVEMGYFFIELPAGNYKLSSISIPVGSSIAEEPMDVDIEVEPSSITYIGTLEIMGTKEKIRLGGVPLIKPGFEYDIKVIDERQEGINTFKKRYPEFKGDIMINLMKVNILNK